MIGDFHEFFCFSTVRKLAQAEATLMFPLDRNKKVERNGQQKQIWKQKQVNEESIVQAMKNYYIS